MSRFIGRLSAALTISALLLGTLALPAAAGTNIETLLVDDNGVQCPSATFTSIQDAIDYAGPGDTIIVCPGTYTEQVVVNKSVTVKANPLFTANIVAPASLTPVGGLTKAVAITADNATLRGFRIKIDSGPQVPTVRPSALSCSHVDIAVHVQGVGDKVTNNKIVATGTYTRTGACGYDYGIVVGDHDAPTVRPTGTGGSAATARVTFNWVTNFKLGGILVEKADSEAFVRRNDMRYFHLSDPISGCVAVSTGVCASTGVITEVQAFGIAVRDGAEVDLIRNAIKSGPNAGSTTVVLTWGILLVGPDSGGSRVHHNSIWRVANGIHTLSGSDGAVISYNHVTTSTFGILVEGTGGVVHHNHVHNNFISIWANAVGNDFHDNNAHDSTVLDCSDDTIGTGTAGTGNTWTNNIGANAIPDAICDPET